jgi:2-keto-3-deoxy-L-rhamnonate aldolase RhmA
VASADLLVYGPARVGGAEGINDEVLTVVMIESPEGVKNADDIDWVEASMCC